MRLNWFQHWALIYNFYLERRIEMEDTDSILERQTLNLNPDMWVKLYKDRVYNELGVPVESGENEIQLTEDDLSELDRFMERQEAAFQRDLAGKHTVSAAAGAPSRDWRDVRSQAEPLSWGEWQ